MLLLHQFFIVKTVLLAPPLFNLEILLPLSPPSPSGCSAMDPRSGYCPATNTFRNLRPPVPLPPETASLSVTDYIFSLLRTASDFSPSATVLIDAAAADASLSYSDFLRRVDSLSLSLSLPPLGLSSRNVALVLCPSSLHVPVLYFSLLSLGVVVSPANPLSTHSELAHLVGLCRPTVIFTVSSMAPKLGSFNVRTIFVDSPEFDSMLARPGNRPRVSLSQSDTAAILYSSGTTGRVKGVELTQRNLIALIAGFHHVRTERKTQNRAISLIIVPLFHVFGFFMLLRAVSIAETLVVMPRLDFEKMMAAIEKYRVAYMPVSPPLVVALVKSELTDKYDLSSLESLGCGGAPLGKDVAERFKARFPNVELVQGYGMTETAGGAARMLGPEESERHGSVGRLSELFEAKIVDPSTGEALPPGRQGELWLRGPMVMKGYVGDKEATAGTFSPDGWLKTGDLCYFDSDGFLYIVDRLKELIKYKGYQVPPAELEHLLLSHPEIADAAVIPYPDEEAGQIPMAFLVRKPGSTITDSQVMDYVAKQVSPYKKIRRVAFVSSIPKNPSGKILRRDLINQAVSSHSKL